MSTPRKWNAWNRHSFLWLTAVLFLVSVAAHWLLGWEAFKNEQRQHNQQPQIKEFVIEAGRDTFENWQSEFLQLIWQVAGLTFLFFVGSSQSKEGDDRKEAKLDKILEHLYGEKAESIKRDLKKRFPEK